MGTLWLECLSGAESGKGVGLENVRSVAHVDTGLGRGVLAKLLEAAHCLSSSSFLLLDGCIILPPFYLPQLTYNRSAPAQHYFTQTKIGTF